MYGKVWVCPGCVDGRYRGRFETYARTHARVLGVVNIPMDVVRIGDRKGDGRKVSKALEANRRNLTYVELFGKSSLR